MNTELQTVLELLASQAETKALPIAERRRIDEENASIFSIPDDVVIEQVRDEKVKGEWVRAGQTRSDAAFIYLHGGAYIFCSPKTHRHLTAALSAATGIPVLSLDYRLAPEHSFPAPVEDAVAAYQWLTGKGFSPDQIVIGGDSAGGGLTVASMLSLRDAGLELPACGVCISPWADLTMAGDSYSKNDEARATRERLKTYAGIYLNGANPKNPLASPVFADLSDLPPLLIQVGGSEPFYDDSLLLESAAKKAGVGTEMEIWEQMFHVWHYYHPMLSEGRQAISHIGEFVKEKISAS